jgi:hypothetical protein
MPHARVSWCGSATSRSFTGELARDAELVERRIVRPTQEARGAHGGAFHHLLVHAGAVIEGQLVCLTAYAGQRRDGWPARPRGPVESGFPAA